MTLFVRVGAAVLLLSVGALAQDSLSIPGFERPERIPEAISFFAPFVLPKILQDEYRLKDYVLSEEFARAAVHSLLPHRARQGTSSHSLMARMSQRNASISQLMSTSSGSRLRRLGTIAMSSNP